MTSPRQHERQGDSRDDQENRQGPVAGHSEEFLARAQAIVDGVADPHGLDDDDKLADYLDPEEIDALVAAIAAALREVDRKAREDCAGIAEACWLTDADGEHAACAETVRAAIRASIRS